MILFFFIWRTETMFCPVGQSFHSWAAPCLAICPRWEAPRCLQAKAPAGLSCGLADKKVPVTHILGRCRRISSSLREKRACGRWPLIREVISWLFPKEKHVPSRTKGGLGWKGGKRVIALCYKKQCLQWDPDFWRLFLKLVFGRWFIHCL